MMEIILLNNLGSKEIVYLGRNIHNQRWGNQGVELILPKTLHGNWIKTLKQTVQSTMNKEYTISHSTELGQHKKIKEYCDPLFCLSCTYFHQTKGNFGRCGIIQKNTTYDGTKKGTGCRAWRINPEIIIEPEKPKNETLSVVNIIRKDFNEQKKRRTKYHQFKKHGYNFEENFLKKLEPFSVVNPINIKKGYYGHRYNHHIINLALEFSMKDISIEDIQKKILNVYKIIVPKQTIRNWTWKFLGHPIYKEVNVNKWLFFWDSLEPNFIGGKPDFLHIVISRTRQSVLGIGKICVYCGSDSVIGHGKRYNVKGTVQRYECKACKGMFINRNNLFGGIIKSRPDVTAYMRMMFSERFSYREIAKWTNIRFGLSVSHANVFNVIHKTGNKLIEKRNQELQQNKITTALLHLDLITKEKSKVYNQIVNPILNFKIPNPDCIHCNSNNVIKHGVRHSKFGDTQRYECKACNRLFTIRRKFAKMRFNDNIIKRALELFNKHNLSTRQIQTIIYKEFNVKVSHNGIYGWVTKFIPNPDFQVNASNRKEVREKISNTLRNKSYSMRKILNPESMMEEIEPRVTNTIKVFN